MPQCASRRNRRITIQTLTRSTGTPDPVETWATWAQVWAERMDMRGRETFTAAREEINRVAQFNIDYRSGLRGDMRILDSDGFTWDIESIAELGYRKAWEITAVHRGD